MDTYVKVALAHKPNNDLTVALWLAHSLFEFRFVCYADPNEYANSDNPEDGWYYINANGYAQKFNPDRPPSRFPVPGRIIVVPAERNVTI
jgi:hypothetical protein